MMQALQIDQYYENLHEALKNLRVVTKPIPKPGAGQVLVEMEAAPCNPADLMFLKAKYGVVKDLPTVPGWEGAGTVVSSGGGLLGWYLKGKRVACGGKTDGDGTWAQYYVVDAKNCIPLRDDVPFEQGASLIINPLTAVGMVETAKKCRHRAIIQTAAASQLGKMVIQIASRNGIPVINVVRRQEQVELLKSLGAEYVLNSESEGFYDTLKALAHKLNGTIAFEAVAGDMTGTIANALPEKSTILVYGALSEAPCGGINPKSLIFEQKVVRGFWLTKWIASQGFLGMLRATRAVQKLIAENIISTDIYKKVSLDQAPEALLEYSREMTKGKVILTPSTD